MAERISEVILHDITGHCQKAHAELGPGVLVVREIQGDAIWSTADDINSQLAIAEREGDSSLESVFRRMLERLGTLNIKDDVLIAIADHRGLRLLQLPSTDPAAGIKAILSAWGQ